MCVARIWLFVTSLVCAQVALADTFTLDFEGFLDGDSITTEYAGVVFTNATVLTAGVNLNEFEFPPKSGDNVVFDSGVPLSIDFTSPVVSFEAFFTYTVSLLLQAFDGSNNVVDSISSAFSSNLAISGDAGSSPNELLSLAFAGGISRVTITGGAEGGSFVMDDVTYTTRAGEVVIPEPSSLVLLGTVMAGALRILSVRRRRGLRTVDNR